MNRHQHLRAALPTWLGKGFQEIVVIDWSSKPPLRSLVDDYQDGSVTLVEMVECQKYFHQAKAKNLKFRIARCSLVCSLDCDVRIADHSFLLLHPMQPYTYYTGQRHLNGSGLFWREDWLHFNGCNEHLSGWGHEDVDLYRRMNAGGWKRRRLIAGSARHIDHSDRDRVANLRPDEQDKCASDGRNKLTARSKTTWVQQCFQVRIIRPSERAREIVV